MDRRARLPDIDDPYRLCGCPAHTVGPGSRTGALLQALLRSARAARAAGAGDLDPRRLRTRRHSALGRRRPGAGVPLRSLSRGRLAEAGGGRGEPTLRGKARDGVQRRLRRGCGRGGRSLRARSLGLDGRTAARSRPDGGTIRLRVRTDRRASREGAGRSWSPRSPLRCSVAAWSSRHGFAAPTQRFASRSSGSTTRATRWGSRWTSVRAGTRWRRAAVVARPPAGAVFARIVLHARELKGSVWLDDVSFGWR